MASKRDYRSDEKLLNEEMELDEIEEVRGEFLDPETIMWLEEQSKYYNDLPDKEEATESQIDAEYKAWAEDNCQ